jgi:hypothetical protein
VARRHGGLDQVAQTRRHVWDVLRRADDVHSRMVLPLAW